MRTAPRVDWPAPTAPGPLDAVIRLPGSKSLTNRVLVLAALARDSSRLHRPLRSRDTLLMVDALRALGTGIEDTSDGGWKVTPGPVRPAPWIDCGLAGNVMRFVPPVAALGVGATGFDGDEAARRRPMAPLLQALRSLGVDIDDGGRAALPLTVHGHGFVRGGAVTLDASPSSQFVSALLLAGARFEEGVSIHHDGPALPSLPHIEMTVHTLREAGVVVDDEVPNTWRVEPGAITALDVTIEPDLSGAAPFLAAALVAGGRVRVPDWPLRTTQGGDEIREILTLMGADVVLDDRGLVVTGRGSIDGVDVDLHESSELTPIVAALAALAEAPSTIRGVAHIRGHETDRLAALATELGRLGAQVSETTDGLRITPGRLRGGLFHTYADHRLVMAAAVLGLKVPGVVIEDVDTVGKTMPDFPALWADLLVRVSTLDGSGPPP